MPTPAEQRLTGLYARHSASALRLAFLMTGDPAAAEDVVQEAFVRLFARFRDRKPPDALEAYLRRSIINLAHDRHRRIKTARAFVNSGGHAPTSHDAPAAEVDVRLVMRTRLRRLPHRQRAALVLRYYEDLSEEQAAEILHCSVHALKQLVQRGLRAMRAQEQGESDA